MRLSVLIFATASCAQASNILEQDAGYYFPMIPVLPVPGFNSTPNGFNSLSALYTTASKQLASYSISFGKASKTFWRYEWLCCPIYTLTCHDPERTNNLFSGTNGINTDFKANLTTSLTGLLNIFWQTAYEAERRVCLITTSINQQSVEGAAASLTVAYVVSVLASCRIHLQNEWRRYLRISYWLNSTGSLLRSRRFRRLPGQLSLSYWLLRLVSYHSIHSSSSPSLCYNPKFHLVILSWLNRSVNSRTEALAFTSAEKAVIQALLQAIITAALAGVEPLTRLSSGLTSAGYLALTSIVGALRIAVSTLQTAATFKWDFM
jgi:hypothetical protein